MKINGENKNLGNRKYCLNCSPFGQHNTKKIHELESWEETNKERKCAKCCETKSIEYFHKLKAKRKYYSYCKTCLYETQKTRWKDRKIEAIKLLGGKCNICGYCKNYAAMEFHHLDPAKKDTDWAKTREKSWDKIIKELKKCVLLCSNCHRETHNPDGELKQKEIANPLLLRKKMLSSGNCPNCGTDVFNTKYCSVVCAAESNRKVKRPSKQELKNLLEKHNFSQLGKMFGVSDNAVRKWVKFYDL